MKHLKFKQLFVSIEYEIYIADGYGSNLNWDKNWDSPGWYGEGDGEWDGLVGELVNR